MWARPSGRPAFTPAAPSGLLHVYTPFRTVIPPGSFIPTEERPVELHVPLSGPLDELTLKLFSFTLSFSPPGSAIVRRSVVLRVVRRVRVETRRPTVFVLARFTAGRAVLLRLLEVVVVRLFALRAFVAMQSLASAQS